MPIIGAKGSPSSGGFGQFAQTDATKYIEDVFSTWLYTGNSTSGGTQTITNSIDLSTKGGLVWIKGRSAASNHILTDTTRGAGTTASNNQALSSNLTTAEDLGASYDFLSAFNTTGFAVTQGGTTAATRGTNYNNVTYASWTFREQPKFFDVVTWTGNGSNPRTIAHNLGSVPGCIIVKETNTSSSWAVWHRSLGDGYRIFLNNTNASTNISAADWFGTSNSTITSTGFSVGSNLNTNGRTLVAYIFAHDAGGFGLTGTDNVITCGSFTTDGSGNATVNLGYEPQWILTKITSVGDWVVVDSMRGNSVLNGTTNTERLLYPNEALVEASSYGYANPTSTGFEAAGWGPSVTFIYIAIRRGPMKVPTVGTSVFGLSARTGTGANATVTGGQTDDAVLVKNRGSAVASLFSSRLTGTGYLVTSSDAAEVAAGTTILQANPWDVMDGVKVGTTSTITNASSNTYINYLFKRAPSFFDEVCYTGTGSARTVTHNLAAVPEMMIVKSRSNVFSWAIYAQSLGANKYLELLTDGAYTDTNIWNNTAPTASVFSVNGLLSNNSASNIVAYLFATCAGVSKVGSYTGNGSTQTIDCGFGAGGARFVLIKRTDSTGNWYVYDTARGMTVLTDPYWLMNSNAAEAATLGSVTTVTTGFAVDASILAAINTNAANYIFLAIA